VFDGTGTPLNTAGYVIVLDNTALTLRGTIDNSGNIQLNSGNDPTTLYIDGTVTLNGGGQLTMLVFGTPADNEITGSAAGGTLDNFDFIRGVGQIGTGDNKLTLVNEAGGDIDANAANQPLLVLNTGANSIVNAGLLEAGSQAELDVDSLVNNTRVIQSEGGGAALYLKGGVINAASGAVAAAGSGALYITGVVTNLGTIEALNSGELFLDNTTVALSSVITALNSGQVILNGTTVTGGAGDLETDSSGLIVAGAGGGVLDGP
jgi:hypothetical protein